MAHRQHSKTIDEVKLANEEVTIVRPDDGCRTRKASLRETKPGDAFKLHGYWFYRGEGGIRKLAPPNDNMNGEPAPVRHFIE
jgi:hypothetical protein